VILGEESQRSIIEKSTSEIKNVHYLGTVPHETIPGCLCLSDVGISLVDDRKELITAPSTANLVKFVIMFLFTSVVGVGYLYGVVRY